MLFLNCIELENSSLGQTIDKIDYFIDTIIFSTFCLYTYIKNPPKGAFTHKTENLPKTSFYKITHLLKMVKLKILRIQKPPQNDMIIIDN